MIVAIILGVVAYLSIASVLVQLAAFNSTSPLRGRKFTTTRVMP